MSVDSGDAGDPGDDEEVRARVDVAGRAVSPTVTLYPQDVEWECDCGEEACEHAAAAVIALRRNDTSASNREASHPPPAELRYRLERTPEGFVFERGVGNGDAYTVVDFPLEQIASGRFEGPEFRAGPDDIAVEKALAGHLRGLIPESLLPRVFRALARVDVTLDGEPVAVSGESQRSVVVVEDAADGFRLKLDDDTYSRAGGEAGVPTLRPRAPTALSGRELHDLERGRVYSDSEVGELVSTVLPSLRGRVELDVRTTRLPTTERVPLRPSVTLERRGENLYVLPGIVYGDPPIARVEDGRLVVTGATVPIRQPAAERAIEERLRRELGLRLGEARELHTEDAIAFVRSIEGTDVSVTGTGLREFQVRDELSPTLSIGASDFELEFSGASASRVLRAWRSGATHVPLDDGGYAPLPLDWLDRFGEQVSDLLAARQALGALPRVALPALAALCDDLDVPRPADAVSFAALLEQPEADDLGSLPPALTTLLRDYQREGVRWLRASKRAGVGALLADDMGLGKTLQALGSVEGRSLVVAPTSVLHNWASEAARFRPDLSVGLFHGAGRTLEPGVDLTLTSHALLRLDAESLSAVEWDTVVIDEAQAIRNPDTAIARAAYGLRAQFRLCLTGTPVENRLLDLWSQLRFLNPGFLGTRSDFEQRYEGPIAKGDAAVLERLNQRVRPFVRRRLKADVAPELPPRTEITLSVELDDSERAVYDAVRASAKREVVARVGDRVSPMKALELLLRLRQAACHSGLVPGQDAVSSSKVALLVDRLEVAAAEGHKALVFSQWTSMLDRIAPHLDASELGWVRLDGSTRDRADVVSRFSSDPAVSVFLLSLKAGGTGLNLTAADHVFVVEPWWNPAVEEQAFDRAHRIGQNKPVFVHRLIASGTVEERMLALQSGKRALAEGATFDLSAPLTRDILLELLEPVE